LAPSAMNSLVDVNVWLPFLVKEHVHHARTRAWFETLAVDEAGLCRVVQLSLLRLLGNRTIMANAALTAADAWGRVSELLRDERVKFHREPPGVDSLLGELLSPPGACGNFVMDAYLAAFAISSNLRLATFDRGFQQFRGLRLTLLDS
jgi:toxin-antitoxin system PIN domain toxin